MSEQKGIEKVSILNAIFADTIRQIELNRNKSWQLLVWYFGIFWVGFEGTKFQENDLAFLFLIIWVVLTTFFFINLRHSIIKLKEKRKELKIIYDDMHKFSHADDIKILKNKHKKFDEREKFGYIDLDEKFMFAITLFFISIFYLIGLKNFTNNTPFEPLVIIIISSVVPVFFFCSEYLWQKFHRGK
jgi:hypothetical protein